MRKSSRIPKPIERFDELNFDNRGNRIKLAMECDQVEWSGIGMGLSLIDDGPEEGIKHATPLVKAWMIKLPRTYREALKSDQRELWQAAIDDQV